MTIHSFIDFFTRKKAFELQTNLNAEESLSNVLKFYNQYKPSSKINEFQRRILEKSYFNLPIQLGLFGNTKYRLTGHIHSEQSDTRLNFLVKDDPYWSVINIIIPIFILVQLISEQSKISIAFSLILLLGFIIRWLITSNDMDRIETEILAMFNHS